MFSPARYSVGAVRLIVVGALAGSLGGCYTLGGDSKTTTPTTPITPPGPAKFTPASGTVNSRGVVTQVIANAYTNATTMTVENQGIIPITIQT